MKTIREWLEELPEPYRTQAIDNAENPECFGVLQSGCDGRLENTGLSALRVAFQWHRTNEGIRYWSNVAKTKF